MVRPAVYLSGKERGDLMATHTAAVLAALDCAVDELLEALDDADQSGAWSTPVHRRSAEQDEAVIRVQESQEAAKEYAQMLFVDRYGLDADVTFDTGVS